MTTPQQQADVDTLEALAQEISAVEGISLARALEAAREQLASLGDYARAWDRWAREIRSEVIA